MYFVFNKKVGENMRRVKNENVKKEYRKKIVMVVIGVVLLLCAFGCKLWQQQIITKTEEDVRDLNSIIVSEDSSKSDKVAYMNAQTIPYKFAGYDDTTDSYYIVCDEQYMYIVYMSLSDFDKLNHESIKTTPIKIQGVTKQTTKDVKELALDAYNDGLEESEQLTMEDFNDYFGEVYLDLTTETGAVAGLQIGLFILLLLFGGILFGVGIHELLSFNRSLKKLDAIKIEDLDNEMNDKEAFYYSKAHLYLTRNYIINFGGTFRIIPYKDILWMYRFEQRTNGIKTAQSLKVLTNEGKTYNIANIDLVTKKSKEIFEEIWNTIVNKNENIVLGYTKENIQAMKNKVKEIKKNK